MAAVSPPPEPISGAVFGMPTIGFPGVRSASRPRPADSPSAAPPMPPLFAQQSQALAAREAGRAQIVQAMQQQTAQWQAPAADGSCELHGPPQARLECDSDALQQIVEAKASVLAGLLDAYRSIDSGADHLAIAFTQGRYQLTPSQRIGASVSSMPRDVTVTAPGL
jgi:hypothetical protein